MENIIGTVSFNHKNIKGTCGFYRKFRKETDCNKRRIA